jgi:hypothetical protein
MRFFKILFFLLPLHLLIFLQEPTTCTLAEFLIKNEGKRCVVVLDVSFFNLKIHIDADLKTSRDQEIEKTEDETALWSLLMPWELGKCRYAHGAAYTDHR